MSFFLAIVTKAQLPRRNRPWGLDPDIPCRDDASGQINPNARAEFAPNLARKLVGTLAPETARKRQGRGATDCLLRRVPHRHQGVYRLSEPGSSRDSVENNESGRR